MAVTSSLDLPDTIEKVVALVARALTHDVHQVNVNLADRKVNVRWTPYSADEHIDEEDETLEVKDLLNHVRIQEVGQKGRIEFSPDALSIAANMLQSLSASRLYAVGWVCADTELVCRWLGMPDIMASNTLLGLPVFVEQSQTYGSLILLGAKFQGAPLRATVVVRAVQMNLDKLDAERNKEAVP